MTSTKAPPCLLAWALLLLLGLGARRDWGCLQCDHSVQEALKQLRRSPSSQPVPARAAAGPRSGRAAGHGRAFLPGLRVNAFVGRVGACWAGRGPWTAEKGTSGLARGWAGGHAPERGRASPEGRWSHIIPWLSQGPTRDFLSSRPPGIDHLDLVASFVRIKQSGLMASSLRGRN